MTIMSNGSSNIIGAAAVPTKAPPSAIFSPRLSYVRNDDERGCSIYVRNWTNRICGYSVDHVPLV
jgi:hypothetical protein